MSPITTDAVLPDDALAAFAGALSDAIAARYPDAAAANVGFEAPRRPEFGDFATNAAFSLAKIARRSPNDVAAALVADVREHAPNVAALFSSIEPVAGFINLRLAPAVWHAQLATILRDGDAFGAVSGGRQRISLEFGSANPTGPLLVVQGRTLSIGDALAKTMRFRGHDVFVEWIINDAGGQVQTLARSIHARYLQKYRPEHPFPEEGYPADYVVDIANSLSAREGLNYVDKPESEWMDYFGRFGRDVLVKAQQETAERFGVHYDLWQSERELHENGKVRDGIAHLTELGLTYVQDGATFFRASQYGDEKDRVVVKSDGTVTYYGADIAYHYEKLKRAERVIDILGPDHHGYIARLKGIADALGYPGALDVLISQQITLMRGAEIVSMSKRAGNIITLDEILDEVGVDAARFFFVMLATDSPLTFDLALAVEKSNENPVYYVQYGHARIASLIKNAAEADVVAARKASIDAFDVLVEPSELALIRRIAELPKVAQGVVDALAPHRLAKYARDVASDFHQFYTECRILVDDETTRRARLALCIATQSVLARVLGLIGVSAPESM